MSKFFQLNVGDMFTDEINPEHDRENILSEVMGEREVNDDFDTVDLYDDYEEEYAAMEKRLMKKMKKMKKHIKEFDAKMEALSNRTCQLEQKTQASEIKLDLLCDAVGRIIIGPRSKTSSQNNEISDNILIGEDEYREL